MNRVVVLFIVLVAAATAADQDDRVELDTLVERLQQQGSPRNVVDRDSANAVDIPLDEAESKDIADAPRADDVLAAALAEAGRRDQSARQAEEAANFADIDASGDNVGEIGPGGSLWVFWALDAPGSQVIAERLHALAQSHGDITVHDCHVMPARAWKAELQRIHDVKEALEHDDPAIPNDIEIRQKTDLRNAVVWSWRGYSAMVDQRRGGVGYLMFENVSAMRDLGVTKVPSFRYISRQGAIHALEGLSESTDLGLWIDRCLAWEQENLAQARHDLLGEEQ